MVFTINSSSVVSLFMRFYERKERKQMLEKVTWLRFHGAGEVVVENRPGRWEGKR